MTFCKIIITIITISPSDKKFKYLWLRDFTMLTYIAILFQFFMEMQTENKEVVIETETEKKIVAVETQAKIKQEKYILLRFAPEDESLALAKSVSKKLGMSLSALCKLSLYTYCKPLREEK